MTSLCESWGCRWQLAWITFVECDCRFLNIFFFSFFFHIFSFFSEAFFNWLHFQRHGIWCGATAPETEACAHIARLLRKRSTNFSDRSRLPLTRISTICFFIFTLEYHQHWCLDWWQNYDINIGAIPWISSSFLRFCFSENFRFAETQIIFCEFERNAKVKMLPFGESWRAQIAITSCPKPFPKFDIDPRRWNLLKEIIQRSLEATPT